MAKISFSIAKEVIKLTWQLKHDFTMKHYRDHMFSFEFVSDDDMEKMVDIGCFHILGQLFVIRP